MHDQLDRDRGGIWILRVLMAFTVANGLFLLSEVGLNVVGAIVK